MMPRITVRRGLSLARMASLRSDLILERRGGGGGGSEEEDEVVVVEEKREGMRDSDGDGDWVRERRRQRVQRVVRTVRGRKEGRSVGKDMMADVEDSE